MKHMVIRLATIFGSVITALLGLAALFGGARANLAIGSPPSPSQAIATNTSELEAQGWTNVGFYGANVQQVVFDPTQDDIYLAVDGEHYKSENGGISWTKVIDRVTSGCVAIDPISGTVYLCVGSEMWMTNDSGATWDVESVLVGHSMSIGLDPNDGQAAFVGTGGDGTVVNTNGYVHRTLDGGQTWISATVDIGYSICSGLTIK